MEQGLIWQQEELKLRTHSRGQVDKEALSMLRPQPLLPMYPCDIIYTSQRASGQGSLEHVETTALITYVPLWHYLHKPEGKWTRKPWACWDHSPYYLCTLVTLSPVPGQSCKLEVGHWKVLLRWKTWLLVAKLPMKTVGLYKGELLEMKPMSRDHLYKVGPCSSLLGITVENHSLGITALTKDYCYYRQCHSLLSSQPIPWL